MAAKFKGFELDDDLQRVVSHLATAGDYAEALQHLQSLWENLMLLGQLSGATTDMSETRLAFRELAEKLLNQLGRAALKKCLQGLGAKAQVAVNILVRNLFERTADIGFLSCDEDIRNFLRERKAGRDCDPAALRRRFGEYVSKYSVYSDIIVLDPAGNVLARFDDTIEVAASADPAIDAALRTTAGYVESFGATDLVAERKRALIYSFRVTDHDGSVLGVLCLCFRLENEFELIFTNLIERDDWAVVTILDDDGAVIASSNPVHIPVGARLAAALDCEYRIVRFGPMEYLAVSRVAQPYQGYGGPGWHGHIMVPLAQAFDAGASQLLASVAPELIERIIHGSELFNEELRSIPLKADHIQRELNRSVWNGNLKQGEAVETGMTAFSKSLLKEISSTGTKTKDVFQNSIADLNKTVLTSLLNDNQFHAALTIDIMDRNLYERANDCRWWALTAAFRELLSQQRLSEQDTLAIRSVLETINGLYTVYSNLILFDRTGRIVAASDPASRELEGTTLTEEWVSRVLSFHGDQAYAVSSFAPTPLYQGRPTYIFAAAVPDARRASAVGGVAIVFDAAPQFAAMLTDALPRDDSGAFKHGAFGVLIEPEGRVLACSDDHFHAGDTLAIDQAFMCPPPGGGHAGFTILGDSHYAVGAKASSGYREYKGPRDAYRNEVVALVFTRLCDVGTPAPQALARNLSIRSDRFHSGAKEEIATFFVGRRLFAVRTAEIVEAIDVSGMVALPLMPTGMAGCLMYRGTSLAVFDLTKVWQDLDGHVPGARVSSQVVVMGSSSGARFGVLADNLGEIADVDEDRLKYLPAMIAEHAAFADAVLALDGGNDDELVVVLRADQLYANLAHGAHLAQSSPAAA